MGILTAPGVRVLGPVSTEHAAILTLPAQEFVARQQRAFNPRRQALLAARETRQKEIDGGRYPHFLPETEHVRADLMWRGAPPAPGLVDRRVELTGPVDRKMVINALNSGATQFMADFEDSHAPTWAGNLSGHVNLRDALRRTIAMDVPGGKSYRLREDAPLSTLLVRPRGWHMEEKHFLVDGEPCSASLFDFSLYFFHNAHASVAAGQGPYFYLPKMESHLEARLWNDVFVMAQDAISMPQGTIRATVLIETILAAFEMDEILYELRDHSSGLNCGRWDYIFSFIKKLRNHPQFLLPDRSAVGMKSPFMDSYTRLLIKTCHQRGVHAMGGMAAQIPIKNDEAANNAVLLQVRSDKQREVLAGHDGSWVAHPALIKTAMEVFNEFMPQANQLSVSRIDDRPAVTGEDLLSVSGVGGSVTEKGLRSNLNVALQYMEAWLRGLGCIPLHNLMEDAATAEISRTQVWQWVRHAAQTSEGKTVTAEWALQILDEEVATLKAKMGDAKFAASRFPLARESLAGTIQGKEYADFLTTLCYDNILTIEEPVMAAA